MKKTFIIIAAILILSCEKDEELTSINGDGTGGFSCILNGTIMNPSGGGIGGNKTCRINYISEEEVYFFLVGFTSDQFGFSGVDAVVFFDDFDNFEGRTFNLTGNGNNQENYGSVIKGSYDEEGSNYSTDSIYNGTLEILHYDRENYTVSGTFEFEAVNELGEVITISDGRFDSRLGY